MGRGGVSGPSDPRQADTRTSLPCFYVFSPKNEYVFGSEKNAI